MSQLRKDGTWTYYDVQCFNLEEKPESHYYGWSGFGLGQMCKKYPWSSTQLKDRPRCTNLHGASGQCWQQTGNDGFFEQELAIELLQFCLQYADTKKYRFRVVEITISQQTKPILETPA